MQPSPSPTLAAEQYRMADLELVPAGDRMVLVYAKDGRAPGLLRAETVDLLVHCRAFATIDDHVRAYCHGRQASPAAVRALRGQLRRLADDGYLISRASLLEAIRRSGGHAAPGRVACIAVPTCDRAETLLRHLGGYVESCLRAGRSIDVVVVDDTPDAGRRVRCRRLLREFAARYGFAIGYAGLEEKLAFAADLAETGDLPEEVVRFACVGDRRHELTTVGANRNAVLLHTIGDLVLSVDDDVACRLAPAPAQAEGVAVSSEANPLSVHSFQDRDAALRSLEFVEADVVALHEQWLGRNPWACVAEGSPNLPVVLDQADPALLRQMGTGSGRVALTLNGMVGDCAWDNPHFHLFQQGETFRRLTRTEEAWRAARASREVVQSVERTTISGLAAPQFAACMGLDNRELLPPFTPVGRAEDVAFGVMLSSCFEGVYAVHLPWVLLHAPPEARSFQERQVFGVGFNAWLPSCLSAFDPGFARTPAERLGTLGRHLEELGRLPERPFEEFVRSRIWDSMRSLVSDLQERMEDPGQPPPAWWLEDARSFVELARHGASTPVEQLYELRGGREATQRLLVRFGQVLGCWPAMVEAARRLRADGRRLAQLV